MSEPTHVKHLVGPCLARLAQEAMREGSRSMQRPTNNGNGKRGSARIDSGTTAPCSARDVDSDEPRAQRQGSRGSTMTANRIEHLARKLADTTVDNWNEQGFDVGDMGDRAREMLFTTYKAIAESRAALVATLTSQGDLTKLEHRYVGPFGVEMVIDMVASMPVIGANLATVARQLNPQGLAAYVAQLGQAGRIAAADVAQDGDDLASARKRRQNAGERSLDSSERGKPARDVGQRSTEGTTGAGPENQTTGKKKAPEMPN